MTDRINDTVLIQFLNNETSQQENEEILRWVSASDENRDQFRQLHQALHLSKIKLDQSKIDIDQAWNKISSQLPKSRNNKKVISLVTFYQVAVSIFIFLTVGFGSLWVKEHFFNISESGLVQFEAPKGEKSKIVLADGTHVWLNSETILKYDAKNPRKAVMQGEAYFEVVKDQKHPFQVFTSSGMTVTVTGTKFNLRCYDDEPNVETSLEEGEVSISGINSDVPTILKPGQQANYDIKSKDIQVHNVSAENYSIWRNNELQFSDITFEKLIPRIERWYGISIKLDPGIGQEDRYTMTIKTESLRELLNMMKLTSNFNYEINGSFVEIHRK